MISEGKCCTPGHSPTLHQQRCRAGRDCLRGRLQAGALGCVTASRTIGFRIVNRTGRGGRRRAQPRDALAREVTISRSPPRASSMPRRVFTAPRDCGDAVLASVFSGDGGAYGRRDAFFVEYYSKSRRLVEDVRHLLLRFGVFPSMREKTTSIGTPAHWLQITDRDRSGGLRANRLAVPGSVKQLGLAEKESLPAIGRVDARAARSNFDTLPREAWPALWTRRPRGNERCSRIGVKTNPATIGGPCLRAVSVHDRRDDAELRRAARRYLSGMWSNPCEPGRRRRRCTT